MSRSQEVSLVGLPGRPVRLAAAAGFCCVVGLCLLRAARAGEDATPPPTAEDDGSRRELITTLESKQWLSNASCVSCHFQVPRQIAHDAWKAAMVKNGYLGQSHFADTLWQKKGQKCADCHQTEAQLHGQCARGDGCLRNAGNQKKVTYLGVSVGAVPQAVRQHVKLPPGIGLMIESVEPDSPAANADLRNYDILQRLDRQILVNQEQFAVLIKTYQAGEEVSLDLIRANESKTFTVKLGEKIVEDSASAESGLIDVGQLAALKLWDVRTGKQFTQAHSDRLADQAALETKLDHRSPVLVTYLGIDTSQPPDALGEQLKLPKGLYLVVDSIEADSPAAVAGLRPFDLLQKLDDQLLVNAEQLTVLIRNHGNGDEVELTLIRAGQPIKVRAKLAEHQVGDANVGQSTVVFDYDNDGGLDLLVNEKAEFVLMNDNLSKAVDLSITGGELKDDDFFRRIYLDLTGVPPPQKEIAEFTADTGPNKRKRLVERLLSRSDVIGKLSGSEVLQWSDNEHSLVLTATESGEKRLLAKDKSGGVVFDGPINSSDQRKQLDPRLVPKLELMLRGLSDAPQLDRPADAAIALERTIPRFQADEATLNELLDRLRRETGANIVVDRKALADVGVKLNEPLSLDLHDVRALTVLKTLLALAGSPKARLIHEIDDGVVLITAAR